MIGLNILTGEIESIIVSVNLILGDRADRDLIQTGELCLVEALFEISNHPHDSSFNDLGIEMEQDGSLLLVRELSAGGKYM